jgi:outer membrane protein assembly factor BamD (BamD/ComL family)
LGKRKRITKKGLKHDALLETAAKGTKFVEQHLNKVVLGAAAVVVVIIVAAMIVRGQRGAELQASAALTTATHTMNAGLQEQAAAQLDALITTYPGTRSAGAATCYLGVIRFHEKSYDEALTLFDTFLTQYRRPETLRRAALEGKAAVFEQRREFLAASEIYQELAAGAGDTSPTAAARHLSNAIRCFRELRDWQAVKETSELLIERYPNVRRATLARVSLAEAEAHIHDAG